MFISINDFLKNRDKEFSKEYSSIINKNCLYTLECTNKLLSIISKELNIKSFVCNSGWRPKSINNATIGSDPNSPHVTGEAIDIGDKDNILKTYIGKNPKIILDCGFKATEEFIYTKTWLHLQTRNPLPGQKGKVIWNCILLKDKYVWQNNYTKEVKNILI